ncbi:MAG TPA: P-type conjugative transfer protein TrbG [Sphingomicrobium sp.]|nr:P-type conjugative transfer protein TrbG [Sphingomicrobium sp.]
MIRPLILTALSTASLAACSGAASAAPPPSAALLAAHLISDQPIPPAAPKLVHSGGDRRPPATHIAAQSKGAATSMAGVQAANRDAVREPDPGNFLGAVQVYPWSEGALYRLYAAPGEVSDIALQRGETLVSVAAGDTVRWIIGDTASGSGTTRRTHILVKPSATGLTTNLVIATDRRVYHVLAESNARTAMTSIAWAYPDDALVALRGAPAPPPEPVAADVVVGQLNFDYRIEGDNVPWRPIRAFDDGRQVFIQFPPTLLEGEAPPLFVTGDKGRAELVNYRIRGRYYVVDRLFAAAELRMGEKRQQVVRISRGTSAGRGRTDR